MAGVIPYGTDTGSANSYVTSISGVSSLSAGLSVLVSIVHPNTGPSTLNVSGTGAVAVTLSSGAPIPPGTLGAGQLVIFSYDGSNWQIAEGLISGLTSVEQFGAVSTSSGATDWKGIQAADNAGVVVLSAGKTYYINSGTNTINSPVIFSPGSLLYVASGATLILKQPPIAGATTIFANVTSMTPGTVIINGSGYAEWFGAVGDGSANDGKAIQVALTACQSGIQLLGKIYYVGTTTIQSPESPRSIIGLGALLTTITYAQSAADCLYFYGMNSTTNLDDASAWEIRGLTIKYTGAGTPTSGAAIDVVWCSNGVIRDVQVFDAYVGIQIETLQNCLLDNIRINHCYHAGLNVLQSVLGCSVTNLWEYGNASADPLSAIRCTYGLAIGLNSASYYIEGVMFTNCSFTQNTYPMYVYGVQLTHRAGETSYLRFDSCFFDTSTDGVVLDMLRDSLFYGCWFANSTSSFGIQLNHTDGIEFHECQAFDNAHDGVVVESTSNNFKWIGGSCRDNSTASSGTNYGINILAGATDFVVQGATLKNGAGISPTQGWGVVVNPGASDRYIITNNLVSSNVTGGVSDGGSGTHKNVSNNF